MKINDIVGAHRRDIRFNFGRRGNGKTCKIFLGKMVHELRLEKKGRVLPALLSPKERGV